MDRLIDCINKRTYLSDVVYLFFIFDLFMKIMNDVIRNRGSGVQKAGVPKHEGVQEARAVAAGGGLVGAGRQLRELHGARAPVQRHETVPVPSPCSL